MEIVVLFTAVGLGIFLVALIALTWSVRSGQLDDLDTPAMRMLADPPPPHPTEAPDDDHRD
jgi:cbb3-type cytochrome oxidase maturation protein